MMNSCGFANNQKKIIQLGCMVQYSAAIVVPGVRKRETA